MLKYTGHPLMDIGVATIWAFSGKPTLSKVTEKDLDKAADYIARHYVVNPLKSFLVVAFQNSGFLNPNMAEEKRAEYIKRVLYSYRSGTPTLDERCVFTGEPAVGLAFSEKLPPGRAFRQHVLMLTGEGVINFFPGGDAGLPISGTALLCIQAFPLGCAKCGGKLLAVHSDNAELMEQFAAKFLVDNRRRIDLAEAAGSKSLPEAGASAKTLLIEKLLEIELARLDEAAEQKPYSVTAYHLTNYGQSDPLDARNPPLEIYHLPLELTDFLGAITHVEYRSEWRAIERRAWRMAKAEQQTSPEDNRKKRKAKTETPVKEDTRPRRNFLYEDLFDLPGSAPKFVRRYLLRIPVRNTFADDPRRGYSIKDDASLVSWKITELFLESKTYTAYP